MRKENIENNPVLKKSFDFSLSLIDYCELLESNKKYIVARQLLRCGTSVGANAMEAQNAESKADFIHKMKIAAKESEETQYWLLLCSYSKHYPDCDDLLIHLESVSKLLSAIISSSKRDKN